MNALVKVGEASTLAMTEADLMLVLRNSLYPGAKDESIKMVIQYCKAAHLDPLQKPVHIVPMRVKVAGSRNEYEWRDVVMPGIGLYRTQATRTEKYAGVSEPEFGEDVEGRFGDAVVTHPAWCRVVVKRLLQNGVVAEFAAKELWMENYATAGKDSSAPNQMWRKRPYGQLAKCAEAQALRKAFPEIGEQPTAEEMEGKEIDAGGIIDARSGDVVVSQTTKTLPNYTDDQLELHVPGWRDMIDSGKATADRIVAMVSSRYSLAPEQIQRIHDLEKSTPTSGEDGFVAEMNTEEAQ